MAGIAVDSQASVVNCQPQHGFGSISRLDEIYRTNPAQKTAIYFYRTTPHKVGLAHNSAQDFQLAKTRRCTKELEFNGLLSYMCEPSLASDGNYEQ